MASLKETETWENHIYQIEENDPVHGGDSGVTNKPLKQLSNRTLYLRKLLVEAGQRLTPKSITANSRNSIDLTGHTHEIAKASTTQAGLVQLVDNLTSADNSKALTAAQGKALNDKLNNTQIGGRNLLIGSRLIRNKEGSDYFTLSQNINYSAIRHLVLSADFDVVNFKRVETPNATTRIGFEIKLEYTDGTYQYASLWKENRSNTQAISVQGRLTSLFNVPENKAIARISSASMRIQAATADKMVVGYPKLEIGNKATDWTTAPEDKDFIKIPQNGTPVTLNLMNKAALTAYLDQLGNGVLQQAHYQFVLANNSADNITGLPLGDKAAVQLDLSVRSGVSILSCHYLNNNRKFSALVDFNKADYSINWQEELKLTDGWIKTPLKVENSIEAKNYLTLKRNQSDLAQPAVNLDNQAADLSLPTLPRDIVLGDQRFLANGATRIYWRGVLKQDKSTTLAAILKNAEGADKYPLVLNSAGAVGINGSTGSNTTAKLGVNGTAFAIAPPNEANNGQLVTSAWVRRNFLPRTVTGTRELIFDNGNQPIYRVNNLDGSWWQLNFSNPGNNRSFQFTNVIPGEPYRYLVVTFPAYDKNEIVAYQSYVNNQVTNAKNWATGAFLAKTVESSLVHVAGNETITGEKTFHYHVKLRSNADDSKLGRIGQNSNDLFIQNGYSGKYLQLKNTGELRYNDNLIHDDSMPYVKMTVKNSDYGGIDISRSGTSGTWMSRIEALPDKRWKFHVQNSHDIYLPVKSGTVVLDSDCSNAGGANKVVKTDGSGDVIGRLFRATYQDEARIQGAIAFRVNNSNDNYTRYCNSPAAVRTWLGVKEEINNQVSALFTYQKIGNFEIRKYPDGTMIQTYLYEINDLKEWNEKTFTWAVAFKERPLIMGQITTSVSAAHDAGVNILSKSTNATVFYHMYEHGNPNQGLCRVQFMAIGRWK